MDNQPIQPNIPQEPQQPQPTLQPSIQPETPQKQSLPTWTIVLIVVGAIIVLAGASYGVYWYFASQPDEPSPTGQGGITPGQLPTGEPADETTDWQTYRNEKYGFSLSFLDEWEGYGVEMYKIENIPDRYLETTSFLNGEAVVYFSLEGGPSSLLKIYIHTRNQWNNMTKTPTYITENDKYVFSFDNSIMRMDKLDDFLYDRWQETTTLVDTFKFVD